MAKKNALGRGLDALITFNDSDTQALPQLMKLNLVKLYQIQISLEEHLMRRLFRNYRPQLCQLDWFNQ